jgi:hypothetical protein
MKVPTIGDVNDRGWNFVIVPDLLIWSMKQKFLASPIHHFVHQKISNMTYMGHNQLEKPHSLKLKLTTALKSI